MYEKLTWKPLETNSLADILTMQTDCTQPITVVPAYTPAVVTITGNTPPALVPNKALISLTAKWDVTLNNDQKTRARIKVIMTNLPYTVLSDVTGGETNTSGTDKLFTTSLPLLIIPINNADVPVKVVYEIEATKDGTTWYTSKTYEYPNLTLVAYKPAVISNVVSHTPDATLIKTCGLPVGFTYDLTALNHDVNVQASIDLIGTISYDYTKIETTEGSKYNSNNLAEPVVGTYTVYYNITNSKPGGGFSTLYVATFTNRSVVDLISPVHASCGTMPSPVTVGSDVVVPDVIVTGGNCIRTVYFSVLRDGIVCKPKTIEGDIAIPANYPTNNSYSINIPSSCLPLGGPYDIKIVMSFL